MYSNIRGWGGSCFALCYFCYMGVYISRNNLSIISPQLQTLGIATAAQLGLLTGLFSLGFAAGKLLTGPFGDRFNPKVVAALGVGSAGCANLLIGLLLRVYPFFPLMLLLWVINSFGQAMVWGPLLRLISLNFERERAPFVTAMLVTTTATGGMLGILLASAVSEKSPAPGFFVPGAVSLAAALLLFFLFPGKTAGDNEQLAVPVKGAMKNAFRLPQVKKMLVPAFSQGVIKDNVLGWAALYLAARFEMDLKSLPFFVLLIPAVSFLGRMCYPFFYQLCGHRQERVSILCFLGVGALCLPLILGGGNRIVATVLLVLISTLGNMMNTSFLSIFPMSMHHTGQVSAVASLMDVVTYSGLGISSALFGKLIGCFDSLGYQLMFGAFLVFAVIGCTSLLFGGSKKKKEA